LSRNGTAANLEKTLAGINHVTGRVHQRIASEAGRGIETLDNTIDNMASELRRAPFIVIEGLDRSGKTTQTGRLHARLKEVGADATLIKFPGKSRSDTQLSGMLP
jgi:signal recognition particle GTPase